MFLNKPFNNIKPFQWDQFFPTLIKKMQFEEYLL